MKKFMAGIKQSGRGFERREREAREFEEAVLEVARVTRVTKGGKRMRFRATVVIGDRKGRVGFGVGKAADVAGAVSKANRQARKRLFSVSLAEHTIPHQVRHKFGAARIMIKPAPRGTGIKAGGAMRLVLELAGIPDVVGKQLGTTKNKINNVKAVLGALRELREPMTQSTTD